MTGHLAVRLATQVRESHLQFWTNVEITATLLHKKKQPPDVITIALGTDVRGRLFCIFRVWLELGPHKYFCMSTLGPKK